MSVMRRATAVRRLRALAERCQQVCHLWEQDTGLVGVHTFGSILDPSDEDGSIEVIQIVLVVDEHPDQVTWCARPATFSGLPYVLDLEKAPIDWYFRPAAGPVGNHRIVRPLPIWSRAEGVYEAALTALSAGDAELLDGLREPGQRPRVVQRQLAEELAAAEAHLQRVRDQYWARGWRKAHHAAGTYPENYLWDAVNGYLDLVAAAQGLPGGPATVRPKRVPAERPGLGGPGAPTSVDARRPEGAQPALPVLLESEAVPDPVSDLVSDSVADPPGPAVDEPVAGTAAVSAGGTAARRSRRATAPARRRESLDASAGS
jgi:hypothetical protein